VRSTTRSAVTAGLFFGGLASLTSLAFVTSGSSVGSGGVELPGLVVGSATVVAAAVGAVAWAVFVERSDRWSVPVRGAVAGGATVWGSITLVVPVVVVVDQLGEMSVSTTAALEVLVLAGLAGTLGMVAVGVFFLPVGLLAGYLLGRRRSPNPGPVPLVSRLR
jgi:hypothetical protein